MHNAQISHIYDLIKDCSQQERQLIFSKLRKEFPIHPLEQRLNTSAEIILEAIARSSDLTLRGVRGVIAEAAFNETVIAPILEEGWQNLDIAGDQSYDFHISDSIGDIKIQVKMQRQKQQRPMTAAEASKKLFTHADDMWVVETQRTRGGTNSQGENTRPYRYGEFDVLAVSLHPSTNDWSDFLYTVGRWLVPDPKDGQLIFKYQPVPAEPNSEWTSDLRTVVDWFRTGAARTIQTTSESLLI